MIFVLVLVLVLEGGRLSRRETEGERTLIKMDVRMKE